MTKFLDLSYKNAPPPGCMDHDAAIYLEKRHMSNLCEAERKKFEREALYLMPTWAETKPITLKYLQAINNPIAVIRAENRGVKNLLHLNQVRRVPDVNVLMVGARAMLLTNYVIESGLYNGMVGTIQDIVYEMKAGPNSANKTLLAYVGLDIPTLKWDRKYVWDKQNPTFAPIPPAQFYCDNMCCTSTTIPLRVFKGSSIHKCQGMSIGDGMPFESMAIKLPSDKQRKTPGMELVAFSRATEYKSLCLVGKLSKTMLLNIGVGKSYKKKKNLKLCYTNYSGRQYKNMLI